MITLNAFDVRPAGEARLDDLDDPPTQGDRRAERDAGSEAFHHVRMIGLARPQRY